MTILMNVLFSLRGTHFPEDCGNCCHDEMIDTTPKVQPAYIKVAEAIAEVPNTCILSNKQQRATPLVAKRSLFL